MNRSDNLTVEQWTDVVIACDVMRHSPVWPTLSRDEMGVIVRDVIEAARTGELDAYLTEFGHGST